MAASTNDGKVLSWNDMDLRSNAAFGAKNDEIVRSRCESMAVFG